MQVYMVAIDAEDSSFFLMAASSEKVAMKK